MGTPQYKPGDHLLSSHANGGYRYGEPTRQTCPKHDTEPIWTAGYCDSMWSGCRELRFVPWDRLLMRALNFGWICILEGGARREDLAETLQSAPVLITGALRITVTQPSHDASPCDPDLRAIIRLDQPIQSLPRNP